MGLPDESTAACIEGFTEVTEGLTVGVTEVFTEAFTAEFTAGQ